MKPISIPILLSLLLTSCRLLLGAAEFRNGDFESLRVETVEPSITYVASIEDAATVGNTFVIVTNNVEIMPGWYKSGSGSVNLTREADFNPIDGGQQMFFNTGNTGPGGVISQTFSTQAGRKYDVVFYVGRLGDSFAAVSITAKIEDSDGLQLGLLKVTPASSQGYVDPSVISFIATGSLSTLIFADTSTATEAVDVSLDGVSVTLRERATVGFANGSFESLKVETVEPSITYLSSLPVPPSVGNTFVVITNNAEIMPGWYKSGSGSVNLTREADFGPIDGGQQMFFNTGNTSPGGVISQTVRTWIGQSYDIFFYVGRLGSSSADVSITATAKNSGGQVLGSLKVVPPGSSGYTVPSVLTFIATSSLTTISFSDTSTATTAVDVSLDSISVALHRSDAGIVASAQGSMSLIGIVGKTYRIDYRALNGGGWTELKTVSLVQTPYQFADATSQSVVAPGGRIYRAVLID